MFVLVGDSCTTPNSEVGQCRNVKNCPSLLEYVKDNEESALAFLRKSNCGFLGLDPLVCCPELSSPATIEDGSSVGKKNSTNGNSEEPSEEIPDRSINQQCGKNILSLDRIVGGDPAKLGKKNFLFLNIE